MKRKGKRIVRRKKYAELLFLSGILTVSGTAAYLTAYDQKKNSIVVGHNTTRIVEDFPDPDPIPIPENPVFKKTVQVFNGADSEEGCSVDCFVRVALSYSNDDIGRAVTLLGLNEQDWEYHEDGFYYYKYILKQGASTSALFTGFQIDGSKAEGTYGPYVNEFSIGIYEESIQAGTFLDYQEAWSYYLNPAGSV